MNTSTWNVYKIFASGKRAKKPIFSFEHDDEASVNDFFQQNIKPTFTIKQQKSKYFLIRADLPQERAEKSQSEEESAFIERSKVLRELLKTMDKSSIAEKKTYLALLMEAQTNWKWQWAVLEAGTLQYLLGVSPFFENYNEAADWMEEKVRNYA